MPAEDRVLSFISSSFRSVWAIEVLRFLVEHPDQAVSIDDLIVELRISHSVATQSLASLEAAGLILTGDEGQIRFRAPDEATAELVSEALVLYARSPDRVRRTIVSSTARGISAFSDAFRFRR